MQMKWRLKWLYQSNVHQSNLLKTGLSRKVKQMPKRTLKSLSGTITTWVGLKIALNAESVWWRLNMSVYWATYLYVGTTHEVPVYKIN